MPRTGAPPGGWGNIQLIRPPDQIDNPLGPMRNSVIDPGRWDDGSLIMADPDPAIYVMEGGERRWIPSPAAFRQLGYIWDDVQHISSVEVNAILRGADKEEPPFDPDRFEVRSGPQFLGAGHYMETDAQLLVPTGQVTGQTRTWTVTALGGFHGACSLILSDMNDFPVPEGQSPVWRYGVDGWFFGNSNRTDAFTWYLDLDVARRVRYMRVFHTWAPNDFQTVLDAWVTSGQKVAQLAQSVQTIAKVVAAIASGRP